MAGNTFTTYVNAKRTGSVDAEFAAIGNAASKSLSGIQQKADAASRALNGIGKGGSLNQWRVAPRLAQDLSQATQATERLTTAQARLARENSNLVRSLRTTGQTLQVVQGPLGPIAGRVNAAADALARLTGVSLGLAGAGAALFAYTSAANKFVELRSKLAPLFESQEQVNNALDKVSGIALRARSGLEPVVDLYAKLKLGADQFGISQERALRITELASKAATLSGGSSQSREAGLYQFAQGFGSGNLGGDELKSVRENTLFLAKALSDGLGKLPEFKGVDTSIGKLKELGAEGKLTAEVIARAMEASAGSIDEAFKRLPPTMATAFTSLRTNATLFIGQFEEATGIVGTLASGILILGNNLNAVVAILGGVAAGWAGVAAAAKGADFKKSITDQVQLLTAQRDASKQALENAKGQRSAAVMQTASLKAQQAQINANIVSLEKELAVQREIAAQGSMMARVQPAGPGRRIAGEANAKIAQGTKQLADEIENLSVVTTRGEAADRKADTAKKNLGAATADAAKKSSVLRTAAGGLLSAINPLGIAVGLATSAFLAWAMAESEAEKNAKKVEDAQRRLATVIDFTTGKILEQNAALLAGAKVEARTAIAGAQQNYLGVRSRIAQLAGTFTQQAGGRYGGATQDQRTPAQRQAADLLRNYGRNGGSTEALVRAIDALAKADPTLRSLANNVAQLGKEAVEAARAGSQLQNSLGLLEGRNDEETRRRAAGDFSGGRSAGEGAGGKSEAQIAAEVEALRTNLRNKRFAAEVQMNESLARLEERRGKMGVDDYIREKAQIKATYDSAVAAIDSQAARAETASARRAERDEARRKRLHEAELARIERENRKREQRTEKRNDVLQQWSEDPKAVVKATDQIDDLNRMVGETLNGIAKITDANPLGEGIYTQAMADGDAERIREGLQRPYSEFMESQQRELNIQGLILEGRDLEAEALRRAYDLHEQIGAITEDQYNSLLEGVRAEEQINDVLAQRERLLAPLRSSVEELRGSITSALEDFLNGGNPAKGIGNILKGMLANFNRATAVGLAEKITGGMDQRVRDLIRGSVAVDSKIADYVMALDAGASTGDRLSTALDRAATAADSAATALQSVAGSGAGGGAAGLVGSAGIGAAGAAGVAMLQSLAGAAGAIPSSFYKPGVKLGGGKGDDVIFKALGSLGGVITENLRSQATQNDLFRRGLTDAQVSKHTTTNEAYDVRLPRGMSFERATSLIRKAAQEMGMQVVSALDETRSGGTGRHGHYVFGRGKAPEQSAAIGPATVAGLPASIITSSIKAVADVAQELKRPQGADVSGDVDVLVTGPRRGDGGRPGATGGTPSPTSLYNMIGQDFGAKLDKLFGTKFFKGIGGQLGIAMKGAQTGAMASGVARALGIKQSATGAKIGGAVGGTIGTAVGGPLGGQIGGAIGGLAGGTIGQGLKNNKVNWKAIIAATALFGIGGGLVAGLLTAKAKKGSVTLGGSNGTISVGDAVGNDKKFRKEAAGLGDSVSTALQGIADQLDATIGGFSVSIGKRKGKFVVDREGRGRTKTGKAGDGVQGYETEEEAVRAALEDAIRDGALAGISAASRALLTGGKALESQLRKVQIIESIPKRLMAIKDPVRFAISELNKEFAEMIRYLQEGGATAAQFAEAQELYELERVQAIEQATNRSVQAIQDYIDNMMGGTDSPLNRRTVYENAQAQLSGIAGDVQAGRVVDNDELLRAVERFQAASRALNGSNESFFADFDSILNLLNTARTNITGSATSPTDLPASPFSDAQIQGIINGASGTTDAVIDQTAVIGGLLGDLIASVRAGGGGFSAIDALPSSGGTGGRADTSSLHAY